MLRYLLNKMLRSFHQRYNYDVRYQQEILNADLVAFLKFSGFQTMSCHAGDLPAGPLFAARLRAIIAEDCGPCTQLAIQLALEAGLAPELIQAIIERDLEKLPEPIKLVVVFSDLVLAHHPQADDLRPQILQHWGKSGLIAIGFAISSYRVYPTLKYTLGYGKACSRVLVDGKPVLPTRL
jgi:thiol-disulfide isomerase/thioredoxin